MLQIIYRGFWRRWIFLLVIAALLLTTLALWFYKPIKSIKGRELSFDWLGNKTSGRCRNSKQGPIYITDEKGYLCTFEGVLTNGCCDTTLNNTVQYSCSTCQPNRCCHMYEYCIACCLHPAKKRILESVLAHAQKSRNPLLRSVRDRFELCLHKCRTSSSSVIRENTYRDILHKYCYGVEPPDNLSKQQEKFL